MFTMVIVLGSARLSQARISSDAHSSTTIVTIIHQPLNLHNTSTPLHNLQNGANHHQLRRTHPPSPPRPTRHARLSKVLPKFLLETLPTPQQIPKTNARRRRQKGSLNDALPSSLRFLNTPPPPQRRSHPLKHLNLRRPIQHRTSSPTPRSFSTGTESKRRFVGRWEVECWRWDYASYLYEY